MNSKINKTLITKLFTNPAPLGVRKDIFNSLNQRMFPCKDVFILFLTTDLNEQIECAKYIIQRLCFESNFPPPYSLMTNLADFEHDEENITYSETYIPQDHFLHIVYMYLLGIYMYFYMPKINSALTNEFIRKRRDKSYFATLDAAKDFLSYWKYFCLYHDLAYPIERKLKDKKSVLYEADQSKYITPINEIFTLLFKEILAESAAKLIVLWQLINDTNNIPFSHILLALPDTETQWERDDRQRFEMADLQTKFEQYKKVEKVYCYEHFKMFSGYLARKCYLIVLFDARNEQPVAIREKKEDKTVYYFLKTTNIRLSRVEAKRILDNEDAAIPEKFKLGFFIKYDECEYNDFFFKDESLQEFDRDRFEAATSLITSGFRERPVPTVSFQKITTGEDFGNYVFQVYCNVITYLNEMMKAEKNLSQISSTVAKLDMTKKLYLQLLKDNLQKEIEESFFEAFELDKQIDVNSLVNKQEGQILSVDDITQTINSAFDKILASQEIKIKQKEIANIVAAKLYHKLEKAKAGNGALVDLLYACNKCIVQEEEIELKFGMSTDYIIDLYHTYDTDELTEQVISSLETDVLCRMKKFSPNTKCKLDQWMNQYHTRYTIFDHGIVDSLLFLSSIQYYRKIIEKVFEEDEAFPRLLSTLCWNVDHRKYKNKLQNDYGHVCQAVMHSICYHNIYPSSLKEIYGGKPEDWFYTFQDAPSTYFAMMIDSLQIWGRDKYYSKSALDYWPNISSDGVNISIQGDHIVLQLEAYNNNLAKLEKKYITEVEKYLKELSTFVQLEVKQSR